MAETEVVKTINGKHCILEVVKSTSLLQSPTYYVYKNGSYYKGGYSSLSDAVAAASKEA